MVHSPISFTLRPAETTDSEQLHLFCWRNRSPQSIQSFLERCKKLIDRKKGYAIVAIYNQKTVGFGLLTLSVRFSEISDIIVNASLRGQGIGTAIIARLIEEARRLEVNRLEIGVAEKNVRARILYERLGFQYEYSIPLNLGTGPETVNYLVKVLEDYHPATKKSQPA